MTFIELENPDIFKQYLLKLLQEDKTFRYAFIEELFKDTPWAETRKKLTAAQRTALSKKHSISLEVIKGLQELFKDEPPASEIITMIKK